MKRLLCALFIACVGALVLFTARDSEAVPSFARKYETSCATCHVGYPKLNSFGEAFRLNGYQYPEDDQDMTKDEPVSLGAEAYKRVFPNAIWPNDISGKPPIALRVSSGFEYERDGEVKSAFEAPSLNLMGAGTMGENVSFYAGAHLFDEGEVGSIDRAFIQLSSLFGSHIPDKSLNVRIGQFIPNMVPFANHRGLALTPYAFNSYSALQDDFGIGHHGGGGETFGIEDFQLGVEASGIVQSRYRWGVGIVNGNGPEGENSSAKDGYGRAAVKIGGMGFDGSGAPSAESSAENWIDNSITVGAFGFLGSYPNSGTTGPNDLERNRWGIDVNILFSDLNVFGGYIRGSDESMESHGLAAAVDVREAKYDLVFAEANYVLFPWLIGIGRYEQASPDDGESVERVVAGATALYRANVKLVVETVVDPDDAELSNLQLKLDFAM